MKGDGGAIGITEDPSAFRRWMVSGPEISRLVKQYEDTTKEKVEKVDTRHHEATRQEQETFISKVQKLSQVLRDMENPFSEN